MKKTKVESSKRKQKLQKYPVPDWMDEKLKPTAEKLDVLERHSLADDLERQAAQLRELKQKPIAVVATATVNLRPKVKEAVLLFAERFGSKSDNEAVKLSCGIRWILESALQEIEAISAKTIRMYTYRDAEGLEDSVYTERLIGDGLEKWKATLEKEDESDTDEE